jgi:hypothetical protein
LYTSLKNKMSFRSANQGGVWTAGTIGSDERGVWMRGFS